MGYDYFMTQVCAEFSVVQFFIVVKWWLHYCLKRV